MGPPTRQACAHQHQGLACLAPLCGPNPSPLLALPLSEKPTIHMKTLIVPALGAGLAVLVVFVTILGGGTSALTAGSAAAGVQLASQVTCTSTGPLRGLSHAQSANAETIVAATTAVAGENPPAERIALMVALAESHLNNVLGGLGGAYGLFQQTPGATWGTLAQIMDPTYAATDFARHLIGVAHWQSLRPWVAAQDVQRSGAGLPDSPLNPVPGVLGGNYKVNWTSAGQVLSLVTGSATTADCGGGPSGGVSGPPSSHGLPSRWRVPAGTSPQVNAVLSYAVSKLGDAYVWAGAGPNVFDCSGLTMMAWRQGGVYLDHYTVDQMHEGLSVPASLAQPGDLVLTPGVDAPGPGLPGHVGIYLGSGLVISAIDAQLGVAVQTWTAFTSGGIDAVVDPLIPPSG